MLDGSYIAVGSGPGFLSSSLTSTNDILISKFDSNGTLDLAWGKGGSFLSNGVNFQGQGLSYWWNNDGISFFNHGFSNDNAGYTNHSTNPPTVVYVGDQEKVLDAVINSEENIFILDRYSAYQNKFSILSVNKNGDANLNFSEDGWLDVGGQYSNNETYISGTISLDSSGNLLVKIGNENQIFLDKTGKVITLPTVYTLTASNVIVNEGSTASFTLKTTNVASGTSVDYSISGVSADDIVGGITSGKAVVGSNGEAIISVALKADQVTEGTN